MQSQQLLVTIRSKFEKVENGKISWIENEIVISFTGMMNIEREDCFDRE